MKTLKVYTSVIFAMVVGLSEVFATILAALCLTGTGTVEARIAGAIDQMAGFLLTVQFPNWLGWFVPATRQFGVWLSQVPTWGLVALAIWGLFRALMAIHGHGALKCIKEALSEMKATSYAGVKKAQRAISAFPSAAARSDAVRKSLNRHQQATEAAGHELNQLTSRYRNDHISGQPI